MAKWIRVAVDIADDPKVWQLADDCGVPVPQAIGHLVGVWSAMTAHACDGDLSRVSDSALEGWARWSGKRGRFAAAFRAIFVDETAHVRKWMDYQGKALAESEQTRKRVHDYRTRKKRDAANNESNADVRVTSELRNADVPVYEDEDVTKRDVTTSSSSPPLPDWPETAEVGTVRERVIAALGNGDRATDVTDRFARRCPRDAVMGMLCRVESYLTGTRSRIAGQRVSPEHIMAALDDFDTNRAAYNAALLHKYIERAMAGERAPPTPTNRKPNAGEATYANALVAMDLIKTRSA